MRAFIAIELPDEIRAKLLQAAASLPRRGLVPAKLEAMHLTLHFLGEVDEKGVEAAKLAMQEAHARPMRISISGVSYFDPGRIKVIFAKVSAGATELSGLYDDLSKGLSERGLSTEKRHYTPHVTIARVKYVEDRGALLGAIERLGQTEFGSFEARSVSLKESVLDSGGSEYSTLYELEL